MPEAQLTLAHATIHLATAPKSNVVTHGVGRGGNDIKAGKAGLVPAHLRDGITRGGGAGQCNRLQISHDDPDGVVAQQYLPDESWWTWITGSTGRGGERETPAAWTACGQSSARNGDRCALREAGPLRPALGYP